jgi:hypothetical protein
VKRIIGGIVLLAVVGVSAGCSSSNTADEGAPAKGGGTPKAEKSEKKRSCGSRATDDCTPRVGQKSRVRVDALYWQVKSAKTATTIGDMTYGLGEKADGVFVVVDLRVKSAKSESVTLTDNVFQLEIGGKTYDTDSDGTIAAVGAGENPFFLEDIGPDATTRGKVVFDVPKRALKKNVLMRFNELGFGTTHAYVKLSSLGS